MNSHPIILKNQSPAAGAPSCPNLQCFVWRGGRGLFARMVCYSRGLLVPNDLLQSAFSDEQYCLPTLVEWTNHVGQWSNCCSASKHTLFVGEAMNTLSKSCIFLSSLRPPFTLIARPDFILFSFVIAKHSRCVARAGRLNKCWRATMVAVLSCHLGMWWLVVLPCPQLLLTALSWWAVTQDNLTQHNTPSTAADFASVAESHVAHMAMLTRANKSRTRADQNLSSSRNRSSSSSSSRRRRRSSSSAFSKGGLVAHAD